MVDPAMIKSNSRRKLKIGIVGCGAIGGSLAGIILKEFGKEMRIAAIFDLRRESALALARRLNLPGKADVSSDLSGLINASDLVVEAASALASYDIARKCLKSGRSVMIMSVGGIVEKAGLLMRAAEASGARIFVPSGALAGIDALKAAAGARIRSVTLTTIKNPASFSGVAYLRGKNIEAGNIKKDTVLFEGSAYDAVRFFPQNINVAAVLSLAGKGARATKVRIIASPGVKKNIHEVRIESDAAVITSRTENVPHPHNPKTSYLAVLAAAAVLRQIARPISIGT
ncbi:MAG: aspartate dehydrogenase [Candidatus Omnitrophota bacterium]|jgi:aspartate dehydrogenase